MKVVICGGGIIGSSTAYYLALKGIPSLIIEQSSIGCAASGKAGGFLAKDWNDSSPIGNLARKSFDMHAEFAAEYPEVDYRRIDTLRVESTEGNNNVKRKKCEKLPNWVDGSDIHDFSIIGTKETTAQVHPYKLTNAFIGAAKKLVDTKVKIASFKDIIIENDVLKGVIIDDNEKIVADVVIFTLGPWSGLLSKLFKIPKITGSRAHSIILKPSNGDFNHAIFTDYKFKSGYETDHEIYPRPDGLIYMCGMFDDEPLPEHSFVVKCNEESCEFIYETGKEFSSYIRQSECQLKQACYVPYSPDGLPLIGKIPNMNGAYIAAGHGVWGILNSHVTGACIAELVLQGECKFVDLKPFSPQRFDLS